jgi:hypothetical protein
MPVYHAQVRDLEARVNAEREEKAYINQEKQALQVSGSRDEFGAIVNLFACAHCVEGKEGQENMNIINCDCSFPCAV